MIVTVLAFLLLPALMKAEPVELDAVEILEHQLQGMYDRNDDPVDIQHAEERLSDLYNNPDSVEEEDRHRGFGGRRPGRRPVVVVVRPPRRPFGK